MLESTCPYPGYYERFQTENKSPCNLFFITKKRPDFENVIRITEGIKKYFKEEFDAVSGVLTIFNKKYPCIRIRDLRNYEHVKDLQQCFSEEGINPAKLKKISGMGLIQIQKYFDIEEFEPGFYKDVNNSALSYFKIPQHLKWKCFENIILSLKPNLSNSNFDAALGTLYLREGLVEIVRIYDADWTIERIKEIRNKVIEQMNQV